MTKVSVFQKMAVFLKLEKHFNVISKTRRLPLLPGESQKLVPSTQYVRCVYYLVFVSYQYAYSLDTFFSPLTSDFLGKFICNSSTKSIFQVFQHTLKFSPLATLLNMIESCVSPRGPCITKIFVYVKITNYQYQNSHDLLSLICDSHCAELYRQSPHSNYMAVEVQAPLPSHFTGEEAQTDVSVLSNNITALDSQDSNSGFFLQTPILSYHALLPLVGISSIDLVFCLTAAQLLSQGVKVAGTQFAVDLEYMDFELTGQ